MSLMLGALPLAGLSVGLLVLLLAERAGRLGRQRIDAHRLPRGLRLVRPLMAVLAFYLKPWVTRALHRRVQQALLRAGLRGFSVDEFVACQGVGALAAIGATCLVWVIGVSGGSVWMLVMGVPAAAGLGWSSPRLLLRRLARRRIDQAIRDLPFMLDLLCLTMEAGLNMLSGLQHYGRQGPDGVLKEEVLQVLTDVRTGLGRTEALRAWGARLDTPAMSILLAQLIQAEQQGLSLLTILRTQADQQRQRRLLALERKALEAPVKLLLPLIVFIFPCTFLILGFPLLMQGLSMAAGSGTP